MLPFWMMNGAVVCVMVFGLSVTFVVMMRLAPDVLIGFGALVACGFDVGFIIMHFIQLKWLD